MTKHIEKKTYTRKDDVVVAVTCDLCGRKYNGTDWGGGFYDIKETKISMKLGDRWPDCGSQKTTSFDVCPQCFIDRVIPAMKQMGADPSVEELDW